MQRVLLQGFLILGLSILPFVAFAGEDFRHGAIMARTILLKEDGQPILVEYDDAGEDQGKVNYSGDFKKLSIISVFQYEQEQIRLEKFEDLYKTTLAKDAEVMSRETFLQGSYPTADGKSTMTFSEVGNTVKVTITRQEGAATTSAFPLPSFVKSVYVRGRSYRIEPKPEQLVLLSFSVDLSKEESLEGMKTLLMGEKGEIIYKSKHTIAPRAGFYGDPELEHDFIDNSTAKDLMVRKPEDEIYGPLKAVKIYIAPELFPGSLAASDDKGKYSMRFRMPYCPGGFEYTADIWAELKYKNFNPKGSPAIPYYVRRPDYIFCYDPPPFAAASLAGAMAYVNALAIHATSATPMFNADFKVDVMFLTGRFLMRNPDGSAIEVTDKTEYEAEGFDELEPSEKWTTQDQYDFDNDGKPDTVKLGIMEEKTQEDGTTKQVFTEKTSAEIEQETPGKALQAVYFSSNPKQPVEGEENEPDLIRVADTRPQEKESAVLLKTISETDLRQTDIYIFRESNGELVLERNGLTEDEVKKLDDKIVQLGYDTGVAEEEDYFYYRIMLRGPHDSYRNIGGGTYRNQSWEEWAKIYQLAEPFQKRESNYLKPGEWIRLVAINRMTGYVGTQRIQLTDASLNKGNMLNVEMEDTYLEPPNLKVWAQRKYNNDKGMLKNIPEEKERHNIIGQEGAALTSDSYIEVFTEWLDSDGRPLPEGLGGAGEQNTPGNDYGLTGRLARSAGGNTLVAAGGSGLDSFPIPPGRNIQVLKISDNLTTPEHFYVQVNGSAMAQEDPKPKFEGNNTGEGLEGRPTYFTPFLTPVFDEKDTWQTWKAYRDIKRDRAEEENPDPEGEPEKPLPSYVWRYRPEYQFSQYELEIAEINRITEKEDGEEEKTNILNANTPVVASTDKLIEILYSLTNPTNDRISAIDGPQDLVFAFGEEEVRVTFGADKQIRFENIEHLASLTPEDFLSIRLYSNQDAGNILWEYAFEHLYIESATIGHNDETETTYYITADDPTIELKAGILGYADRDEKAKSNPTLRWNSDGPGAFAQVAQTSPELGLFDNTFTMPPVKGFKSKIMVSMVDENIKAKWKTVEVRAGEPAEITLQKSGNLYALGQGDLRLDIEVRDGSPVKNLVENGTPVEISFSDSLVIKEQQLSTTDGKAYVVFTGGDFSTEDVEVKVAVNNITKTVNVKVDPLSVEFVVSKTNLKKGESVTVGTRVTKPDGAPAIGVPVSLSAAKGFFTENELITDSTGTVYSQFTAGLNNLNDAWIAQVGYAGSARQEYTVQGAGTKSVDTQDAFLVADESTAGSINLDLYGTEATAPYQTTATINAKGTEGDIIKIGDMADPNLEPLVSLNMNELVLSESSYLVLDEHQRNPARANAAQIVKDHPLGGGRSIELTESGRLVIDSNPFLEFKNKRGFRLDVKPYGNGTLVNYANSGMQLDYNDQSLTLSLATDAGVEQLSFDNVSAAVWHRVAAKIEDNNLYLYVDGQEISKTILGNIEARTGSIELGGAHTRMRSFRIYDYSSPALITFADNSTQIQLNDVAQTLTIKSLGNLGKAVFGSELKSIPVAIIGPTERNYASLVTKAGFQDLALRYYNTFSPEIPVAASNPLGFFISSVHAWTWDSVWEGVKDGVGYLIPYEDFITIGEQLIYLYNKDWENFDATTLAFASIGAATIIPVAKPLKPLLAPLKQVVQAMRRFPGAKHFAGAIGTAVKFGLSGKTDKLANLLPFILIIAEIYKDDEVFEFILSSIESEDDLWIWVDYFANIVTLNGGLDDMATAQLPLSFMFNQAYAKSRSSIAADVIKIMKSVKKGLGNKLPKDFTRSLKELLEEIKDPANKKWAKTLTSGSALRYLTTLGGAKLRAFIRNSKNWRVNRWVVLASVVYLAEEQAQDKLEISEEKWLRLAADVFSERPWIQHGAIFQLSQVAYYHLLKPGSIKDIEAVRPAFMLMSESNSGLTPYKRRIDIVLNQDGGEEWVETKSLAGPFLANWFVQKLEGKSETDALFNSDEDRSYFRQFFHDMRLNESFISDEYETAILGSEGVQNKKYTWYFQDFKTSTSSKSPTAQDESVARVELCEAPKSSASAKSLYRYNFGVGPKVIQGRCAAKNSSISLRDTKNYFEEIFVKYADQLDVKDMVDIARDLSD